MFESASSDLGLSTLCKLGNRDVSLSLDRSPAHKAQVWTRIKCTEGLQRLFGTQIKQHFENRSVELIATIMSNMVSAHLNIHCLA